jgi:putative nucleotidyltransferase with HDIG domain
MGKEQIINLLILRLFSINFLEHQHSATSGKQLHMKTSQRSQIFNQMDSLPSLPATVSKVMSVTADPESSADDLVQAILPDQAMCAAILKIANSAFFGIPHNVATLDKAVTVLGFNEVYNIVLGKAVFNSFEKINSLNRQAINNFWNHSFACGLAAKILAVDLGFSPSRLFIGGLIHDIGKLVFFITTLDEYLPVLSLEKTEQIRCQQMELEIFGIDHGEVGLHLLTRWLFPECLLNAVGFHHAPEKSTNYPEQAIIIQLSDALSILAKTDDQDKENSLLSQVSTLLPEGKTLWQQYNIEINEERLQKWMDDLLVSFEKDSAILNVFTS